MPKINRATHEPLREQVLHHCRNLLMRGNLLPGQKLALRPLAHEFHTSLMPVRDALNRLVADGALEFTGGRRIRVPVMTKERVVELHEIRSSLEGLAGRLATPNLTNEAIDRAEQLIADMEAAFIKKDFDAYMSAHFSFHFTIYSAADRSTLLALIETLWLRLGPSFRQGIEGARAIASSDSEPGDPNQFHRGIITALRSRDARAARDAIETDIATGIEVYRTGCWPANDTQGGT